MRGLEPRTTYYYTVTSMERNGKSDEVKIPYTSSPRRSAETILALTAGADEGARAPRPAPCADPRDVRTVLYHSTREPRARMEQITRASSRDRNPRWRPRQRGLHAGTGRDAYFSRSEAESMRGSIRRRRLGSLRHLTWRPRPSRPRSIGAPRSARPLHADRAASLFLRLARRLRRTIAL